MLAWLTLGPGAGGRQAPPGTYEFINGRWFDGHGFKGGRLYSVGGLLTSKKPRRVDSTLDLTGKYLIPPFGEAHNHNVEYSGNIDALLGRYIQDGIFYVKNPNNLPRATAPLRGKVNIRGSIDVTFANGGLTASGGHPLGVVRRNIERGGMTAADGDGGFYFIIDNPSDLERKWGQILAGKPDFIKTYLLYSEEYAKRRDDEAYFAWKGLDPALLPEIVRRAHGAALRVSTHVETATDFHHAVAAGVDELNHTPGFRTDGKSALARYAIAEADARLAARKRVVVVTTLVSAIDTALQKQAGGHMQAGGLRDLLVDNLRLLKKHGVPIAVGSDSYRQTSLAEALNLHRLGVFDNGELLRMWCQTTAATIFPQRRIGHLKQGYEASFLVLGEDPIRDFTAVQRIERRFKQGEFLTSPAG
jgi:hypothetical protein